MPEAENTVNKRTQLNPRDSSETDDEGTKAGMTMNKWKKCKEKHYSPYSMVIPAPGNVVKAYLYKS